MSQLEVQVASQPLQAKLQQLELEAAAQESVDYDDTVDTVTDVAASTGATDRYDRAGSESDDNAEHANTGADPQETEGKSSDEHAKSATATAAAGDMSARHAALAGECAGLQWWTDSARSASDLWTACRMLTMLYRCVSVRLYTFSKRLCCCEGHVRVLPRNK